MGSICVTPNRYTDPIMVNLISIIAVSLSGLGAVFGTCNEAVRASSASDCQGICALGSSCVVWTWTGSKTSTPNMCYMKAATGWTASSYSGMTSENKDGSIILPDTDFNGGDI